MTLDSAGEPAPLRPPSHVADVAVCELIYQNLIAHTGAVISSFQAKLFQHACRGDTATGFLKMAPHRLVDVLHSDGAIFDQTDLHGIVTVAAAGSFLLPHDPGTCLNHSDPGDPALGRKSLRHPNFRAA